MSGSFELTVTDGHPATRERLVYVNLLWPCLVTAKVLVKYLVRPLREVLEVEWFFNHARPKLLL